MRNFILKLLGGVPGKVHRKLQLEYMLLEMDIHETIQRYKMQGAWEQIKIERKQTKWH